MIYNELTEGFINMVKCGDGRRICLKGHIIGTDIYHKPDNFQKTSNHPIFYPKVKLKLHVQRLMLF